MTENLFVIVIALVLLGFVPFDLYVAWRLSTLAMQKPYIASLTGAAIRSVAIAAAAVLFAILGVQSIVFLQTGERLLPSPLPTLLIAGGAVIVSLPNLYFLRLLRKFAAEAEEYRAHKRAEDEDGSFLHRRVTDVQPPDELP